MTDAAADLLLKRLRAKGVQLRILPDGSLRYKDCAEALTATQEAHVDAHRAFLALALKREQEGIQEVVPERLEDHWPLDVPLPCWGRETACKAFTPEQMQSMSVSVLAAKCQSENSGCGDCTLFHAQQWLKRRKEKRERKEKRRQWQDEANSRSMQYFDEQEADENE